MSLLILICLLLYIFLNLFIYLFIFGCIGSSLLRVAFFQLRQAGATLRCRVWAFSSCALQLWRAGAALCCSVQASHCSGFSCCRAWALGMRASVVVACGLSSCGLWALEHRLSSCGTRAQLLCSMWDLPRPGIEPVSPALAGGFLTTVPPENSLFYYILMKSNYLSFLLCFVHIISYLNKPSIFYIFFQQFFNVQVFCIWNFFLCMNIILIFSIERAVFIFILWLCHTAYGILVP